MELKVIDKNYHGSKYKMRISEALYLKQYKPSLNASSNINEVIRPVLNFLFFTVKFHKYKKALKSTKKQKAPKTFSR